jgi:hypothetical protein
MGTSSVQVVGNAQFREEATAAAQQGLEKVISDANFTMSTPANEDIDVNNDGTIDYTVTFDAPTCKSVKAVVSGEIGVPAKCYGESGTTYCYWTVWDLTANVSHALTGAKVTIHQGVRLIAGLNAALSSCGV